MRQHHRIARSLEILLDETRKYADSFPKKMLAMQEAYLSNHEGLYTSNQVEQLRYYLRATVYKFYLTTLNLEQLWALSHAKREELFIALENSLDKLESSDDEVLLASLALENFLFQGRALLDFYMLYLCLVLKTGHQGRMSRKRFDKAVASIQDGKFAQKATQVKEYFDTHVFAEFEGTPGLSPNNWGTLLKSLRDKIAHRDRLRPSFDSDETLMDKVLFDWPTLRGITYDRFCQYMQNGMFFMVVDLSPTIYELEWKSGPYRPNLWSS